MGIQEKTTILINLFYLDSGVIYTEEEMNFSAHCVAGKWYDFRRRWITARPHFERVVYSFLCGQPGPGK